MRSKRSQKHSISCFFFTKSSWRDLLGHAPNFLSSNVANTWACTAANGLEGLRLLLTTSDILSIAKYKVPIYTSETSNLSTTRWGLETVHYETLVQQPSFSHHCWRKASYWPIASSQLIQRSYDFDPSTPEEKIRPSHKEIHLCGRCFWPAEELNMASKKLIITSNVQNQKLVVKMRHPLTIYEYAKGNEDA